MVSEELTLQPFKPAQFARVKVWELSSDKWVQVCTLRAPSHVTSAKVKERWSTWRRDAKPARVRRSAETGKNSPLRSIKVALKASNILFLGKVIAFLISNQEMSLSLSRSDLTRFTPVMELILLSKKKFLCSKLLQELISPSCTLTAVLWEFKVRKVKSSSQCHKWLAKGSVCHSIRLHTNSVTCLSTSRWNSQRLSMLLKWPKYKKFWLDKLNHKLRRPRLSLWQKKYSCKNSRNTIKILMLKEELVVTIARKRDKMRKDKVVKKLGAKLNE
jgi:hypothetical protein